MRRLFFRRRATSWRGILSPAYSATLRPFLKAMAAKQPRPSILDGLTSTPRARLVCCILLLLKVPIMADDLPREQYVFNPRAGAYIVDDGVALRAFDLDLTDNPDVRQSGRHIPGDHVAGQIIFRVFRDRSGLALAVEPCHQIGHSAMIDVGVGSARAPFLGIFREVLIHVLVQFFLQI